MSGYHQWYNQGCRVGLLTILGVSVSFFCPTLEVQLNNYLHHTLKLGIPVEMVQCLMKLSGSNALLLLSWAPVQIKLQLTSSGDSWSCPLSTVRMHQQFSFMNPTLNPSNENFAEQWSKFFMFFGWKFSCNIVWSARFCTSIVANTETEISLETHSAVSFDWRRW